MGETLDLVEEVLETGMTTGHSDEDWYIKTWYVNNPGALEYQEMPLAVILPDNDNREDQYVQEDTEFDSVVIHFFPSPIDRVNDVQTKGSQTVAMVDRTIDLIRENPTFDSRIVDIKVVSSQYKQPGLVGQNVFHSAEVRLTAKRRVAWDRAANFS